MARTDSLDRLSRDRSVTCLWHASLCKVYTLLIPSSLFTCLYIRARTYLTVAEAYGTCTMSIWLTTMTLWDVLESGNAKTCVNLTGSVCARCGDEVLCGAENAVFGCAQMSVCERA